jgi:hypothetical protein
MFSECEELKVVVNKYGNTIILRIVLKLKNPPKISLLITKLSISQTYIC